MSCTKSTSKIFKSPNSILSKLWERYPGIILLTLITLVLSISLLPLCLFKGYDCHFDDFICQQIPFLLETKRMLASETPWWSWNTYFGENFLGSYSFYTITSPFAWIVALFPRDYILCGIIFALWLKCLSVGYSAYLYLKRMAISSQFCIIGGLLYCFSSFFITNLRYYHFCEPMIMFPLLLIAIENVIENRKYCYTLLSLASFGVVWINYYFALPSFLFAAIYMIFRLRFSERNLEVTSLTRIAKSCGAVLLGILLSSIILIPTILHVSGSTRAAMKVEEANILGYIGMFIDTIRAYIMPSIAEGIPKAFLHPNCDSRSLYLPVIGPSIVLFYIFSNKSQKHKWIKYLIATLLLIALTPLNGIFSGFSNSEYHRWYYALSLLFILASIYYLRDYKITHRQYWLYAGFATLYVAVTCCFTIAYLYLKHQPLSFNTREIIELVLTIFNFILLGLFAYSKKQKIQYLIYLVCISSCASFGASVYLNLLSGNINEPGCGRIKKYVIDNPLEYNLDSFKYRIDANNTIRNIYLLKNRPGTTSFHSVFDKNQNDYRAIIDLTPRDPSMKIYKGRVAHDILLSVKDFYDYREIEWDEQEQLPAEALQLTDSLNRYSRYAFKYYVPIGFCYDTYVKRSDYDALYSHMTDPVKPMLINLVIEDSDVDYVDDLMKEVSFINPDTISFEQIVSKLRRYTATSFEGDTHGFTATTDLDSNHIMFFSVSPDPGFTAFIDGERTKIIPANLGFSAIIVPAGNHLIRFEYFPVGLKLGAMCTIAAGLILLLIAYNERK